MPTITTVAESDAPAQRDQDVMTADDLPTSFGAFKPVGWLMVGFAMQAQAEVLTGALHAAGWTPAQVLDFKPRDSVAELQALLDKAGDLAGFGYEITLLRRYLSLAQQGHCWLLVKVSDTEQASQAAEVARECGATLAVHYRMLTVEELI